MMDISQGIVTLINDDGTMEVTIAQVDPVSVSAFKGKFPQLGDQVVFAKVSGDPNDLIPLILINEVVHDIATGEEILSATKDDATVSSVKVKVSGEVVLNDGEDYAVAFNKLKAEFNKLNDKHNSLVDILKSWTFVAQDGGAALQTAVKTLDPVSTANIDNVKVDKVRL